MFYSTKFFFPKQLIWKILWTRVRKKEAEARDSKPLVSGSEDTGGLARGAQGEATGEMAQAGRRAWRVSLRISRRGTEGAGSGLEKKPLSGEW